MNSKPASFARLETDLRQYQPTVQSPADLHSSILCAVRSAAKSRYPQPALARGHWVVASVFAALLALVAWWGFVRPGAGRQTPGDAQFARPGAQNIPAQASAAMLAPLTQELEFLNRDFRGAVDFLVASVP